MARRKELYVKLHPETKRGGAPVKKGKGGGAGKQKSQNENLDFTADTAEKTGKGRSTVARDVARGEQCVVLGTIVGTCLGFDKLNWARTTKVAQFPTPTNTNRFTKCEARFRGRAADCFKCQIHEQNRALGRGEKQ